MNKLNKTLLVIFTVVLAGGIFSANAQIVYFNGLGRALVTSENLNGHMLRDTTGGQKKDTTSKRKSTDGYTVFDLGVNAQPNETLRASAILRVKNAFGGFYGDGASLVFRQIRLDGIIAKKVKYELGDIDLELTPYTLFNFNEMYHDYESDAFAMRRSVVAYENFNFGNKWRMQGAHAQSSFKFNKIIEKISVRGFSTRTKKSNYLSSPDRLLFGGRIEVLQSKFFQVGANLVRMVDLPQTAIDTLVNFKNNVATFDGKFTYGTDKLEFGLLGEFGFSKNSFRTKGIKDTVDGKDFFYDATVYAKYKPLNIKVFGSYREVGYFFSSPSAQTRRIYDYNATGPVSSPIPVGAHAANVSTGLPAGSLFTSVSNNSATRTPVMLDRMSDETARNTSIQTSLMNYLPQYNNITPYGQATPNRKGMSFGMSGGDVDRLIKADVTMDMLSEIVSEGTPDGKTRKFMGARGGAMLNLHKLLRFEKAITLSGGMRYEKTTRDGVNNINFTSSIIDVGLTVEVIKQLDLIGGYKGMMAKGNEFIAYRNQFNVIGGFNSFSGMNQTQSLLSGGIRYRFSKNTYFTAQGISSTNKFSPSDSNYGINQLFLNYTMIF